MLNICVGWGQAIPLTIRGRVMKLRGNSWGRLPPHNDRFEVFQSASTGEVRAGVENYLKNYLDTIILRDNPLATAQNWD